MPVPGSRQEKRSPSGAEQSASEKLPQALKRGSIEPLNGTTEVVPLPISPFPIPPSQSLSLNFSALLSL
jgi:hypothetical protein